MKEKLYYPTFYQALINSINLDKINLYTEFLYNKYKENNKIKYLLNQIKNISKIPVELISKYYTRMYTIESNFYKDINKDLRENKKDNYLSYIKILYEGIKTKALSLASNIILYRGGSLLNKEIEIIKKSLMKKKEGLPGVIVFSKTFLSFTKDNKIAKTFLNKQKNNDDLNKILFILENDNKIDYSLSTHADIQNISFIPKEKEVLFFPFSSFEIKEIKEVNINKEKIYEIKLLYLGKYINKLEINVSDNITPNSEFKNQILEFGLIENLKDKDTPKYILEQYYKYKKEINYIIGEIDIKEEDLNKDIRIINSCEQYCKEENISIESKNKNEKEIIDNIEIRINNELIPFSYFNNFKKKGKYLIKYSFINNMYNINHLFSKCASIVYLNLSNLNTQNITEVNNIFYGCESLKYINLSNLNTHNIVDFHNMFNGCKSLINIDLSDFDTQNADNLSYLFAGCKSLININISNFNTQNVTNMNSLFYECESLTSINLSNFNTQNVLDMSYIFAKCKSLINIDLSNFYTKNVSNMKSMFYKCESLTNINLSNFNIQNVTDVSYMFCECGILTKIDLSNCNDSRNLINMNDMFSGCKSLKNINISKLNTQNVTDMNNLFYECESLTTINLPNFNTQKVTDMNYMFAGCKSLINIDLSNFNTQNVTDMNSMFYKCESLTNINLSNFNTQKVVNMNTMFYQCESLTTINLSNFNTQNVLDMSYMFYGCKSLISINLTNFDTSKVITMKNMFCECGSLTNIDLSSFNTKNVTDMNHIFHKCKSLIKVNLSNFNMQNINEMDCMFYECNSLKKENIIANDRKIFDFYELHIKH